MRQLGVNTYSYIWSMRAADCVRHLAGMGYRHFELMINPPHLPLDGVDQAARRELRSVLNDVAATVTALNMPSLDHNLASPLARVRQASIAMFNEAIDLATDLGAPWLVVVPGRMNPLFPPPAAERMGWISDSIAALLPRATTRGVGLAIENVPFASFPDAASLGAFVRDFNSPTVGVCYDAANAHFIGESPAEGIAALASACLPSFRYDRKLCGRSCRPRQRAVRGGRPCARCGRLPRRVHDGDHRRRSRPRAPRQPPRAGAAWHRGRAGGVSRMSRVVLVTGAAGLLGRFVVSELRHHGYTVRGLDRRSGDADIEWHVGDVTSPELVRGAMAGADAVLHIAAVPNIWSGDGQTIMRVKCLGTYTVFEAAEAAGVRRAVFCSSDSVAGYTVREGRMLPPRYAPLDLIIRSLATDPSAVS